jgi:hypothetical protein
VLFGRPGWVGDGVATAYQIQLLILLTQYDVLATKISERGIEIKLLRDNHLFI